MSIFIKNIIHIISQKVVYGYCYLNNNIPIGFREWRLILLLYVIICIASYGIDGIDSGIVFLILM